MSYQPHNPYGDPYQAPHVPGPEKPPANKGSSGVWICYVIYCIFVALIYGAVMAIGAVLIIFAEPIARDDPDIDDPMFFIVMGAAMLIIMLPFFLAFAAGPFLPKNRFGWIYGIVLIVIGLTSGCTIVFSVPLLIFWLQKDLKRFYGID